MSADNRPLPAPPKKEKVTRKRSVRFLTKKSSSNVNSDANGSSNSVNIADVKSKEGGKREFLMKFLNTKDLMKNLHFHRLPNLPQKELRKLQEEEPVLHLLMM
jgi:hypothetical protein